MSTAESDPASKRRTDHSAAARHPTPNRRLHRIAEVRTEQGLSLRTVARRMNVDRALARAQEVETNDLTLSMLYAWQRVLEVPVADLLVDTDAPLSAPVLTRARMLKVMKTAAAILERAPTPSIRRMAQMLIDQLVELMPELKGVSPWQAVGQRRTLDEYGRIMERRFSDELLFPS